MEELGISVVVAKIHIRIIYIATTREPPD